MAALAEEELIEKLAGRVAARLANFQRTQLQGEMRYIREKEAALMLGLSVFTLQSWRSKGSSCCPPFSKVGGMVMYSVKELEQYMEERTVQGLEEVVGLRARREAELALWKSA